MAPIAKTTLITSRGIGYANSFALKDKKNMGTSSVDSASILAGFTANISSSCVILRCVRLEILQGF
jgi:hypothetical protein